MIVHKIGGGEVPSDDGFVIQASFKCLNCHLRLEHSIPCREQHFRETEEKWGDHKNFCPFHEGREEQWEKFLSLYDKFEDLISQRMEELGYF